MGEKVFNSTFYIKLSFHVHQRNKEIAYLLANNFPTVTALLLFLTNFLEALSLTATA